MKECTRESEIVESEPKSSHRREQEEEKASEQKSEGERMTRKILKIHVREHMKDRVLEREHICRKERVKRCMQQM